MLTIRSAIGGGLSTIAVRRILTPVLLAYLPTLLYLPSRCIFRDLVPSRSGKDYKQRANEPPGLRDSEPDRQPLAETVSRDPESSEVVGGWVADGEHRSSSHICGQRTTAADGDLRLSFVARRSSLGVRYSWSFARRSFVCSHSLDARKRSADSPPTDYDN